MSELYENLLKATDNTNDITNEKYGTVVKINGALCSVLEEDTNLEHTNVPVLNQIYLETGDKVVIGFVDNSIYNPIVVGNLTRGIRLSAEDIIEPSSLNNLGLPANSSQHQINLKVNEKINQGGGSIVTSWDATVSNSNVPSAKLVKDTIDDLISRISEIEQSGSCYQILFDNPSYITAGTVTVNVTVLKNYSACVGETVTFTSSASTSTTATTDSNGIATATINFSQSTTLAASIGGVSDTATITVSSYLFYDDCTIDLTNQYTEILRCGGANTVPTLTFDTNYYIFDASIRNDSFAGYVIPNIRGYDNIKISAKVELKSTSAYCQIGIGFADSLNINNGGQFSFYRIRGDKLIDYVEGSYNTTWHSNAVQLNTIYYIELVKEGGKCTFNVYDSNKTLLYSDYRNSVYTYSNPYFCIARNMRNTSTQSHIYEIKAELL